jgi:hypothetical protein
MRDQNGYLVERTMSRDEKRQEIARIEAKLKILIGDRKRFSPQVQQGLLSREIMCLMADHCRSGDAMPAGQYLDLFSVGCALMGIDDTSTYF